MWSHFLLVDGDPVRSCKPLVALDVRHSILQVPKPLGQVHLKEIAQQVLQVGREVRGESHLCMGTIPYKETGPVVSEGIWLSGQ